MHRWQGTPCPPPAGLQRCGHPLERFRLELRRPLRGVCISVRRRATPVIAAPHSLPPPRFRTYQGFLLSPAFFTAHTDTPTSNDGWHDSPAAALEPSRDSLPAAPALAAVDWGEVAAVAAGDARAGGGRAAGGPGNARRGGLRGTSSSASCSCARWLENQNRGVVV
jgi:hypothetical protein